MNNYKKQLLSAIEKMQETLNAIKSDLSDIKERYNIRQSKPASNTPATYQERIGQALPLNQAWTRYPEQYRKLIGKLGGISFEAWFGSVKSIEIKDGMLIIIVPDQFQRDILDTRFIDDLKEVFNVSSVEIKAAV